MRRLTAENKQLAESQDTSQSSDSSGIVSTDKSGEADSDGTNQLNPRESFTSGSNSGSSSAINRIARSAGRSVSAGISRSGSQGSSYISGIQTSQELVMGQK